MTDKELNDIKLHISGATIRHSNPFETLYAHKNDFELDRAFLDKFVAPYYMSIPLMDQDKKGIEEIGTVRNKFTSDVIKKLLGHFSWRTRQTGAYFAGINGFREFEDTIGILLLKSEVTYAGTMYALVLAEFNTNRGLEFLKTYLDYYLTKLDLFFDQGQVAGCREIPGRNKWDTPFQRLHSQVGQLLDK